MMQHDTPFLEEVELLHLQYLSGPPITFQVGHVTSVLLSHTPEANLPVKRCPGPPILLAHAVALN